MARFVIVSWRRPAEDHGVCLPCAVVNTCMCLVCIPLTFCFGLIGAGAHALCEARRARDGKRNSTSKPLKQSPADARGSVLTFEGERRLWFHALVSFFCRRAELRDVGPLVWGFLDDHPLAVRLLHRDGTVNDVPLRRSFRGIGVQSPIEEGMGKLVLGFAARGAIAFADGFALTIAKQHPKPPLHLNGHAGQVTCFSEASSEYVATGSEDCSVRLWHGASCIKVCTSQEWSEWTGTMYIGHTTAVTAVHMLTPGCILSGDRAGNVCAWSEDSNCQMLYPSTASAPVTCIVGSKSTLTYHWHVGGFLVGYADGHLQYAGWDIQVHTEWRLNAAILAAMTWRDERFFVASACGLLQVNLQTTNLSEVLIFPKTLSRAVRASFNSDSLIAMKHSVVGVFALPGGHLRAMLDLGLAQECWAATIIPRKGVAERDNELEDECLI